MGRRSLRGLSKTDKGQEEDLFFGNNPCILQSVVEFRVDALYICGYGIRTRNATSSADNSKYHTQVKVRRG